MSGKPSELDAQQPHSWLVVGIALSLLTSIALAWDASRASASSETISSGGRTYTGVTVELIPGEYKIKLTNPASNPTGVVTSQEQTMPYGSDQLAPGRVQFWSLSNGQRDFDPWAPGAERVIHVAYTPDVPADPSAYTVLTYVVPLGPSNNPLVSNATVEVVKAPTVNRGGRVVSRVQAVNGLPVSGQGKMYFTKGAITPEERQTVKSGGLFQFTSRLRVIKSQFVNGRAVFTFPKLTRGTWKAQSYYMGSRTHTSLQGQLRSFVVK